MKLATNDGFLNPSFRWEERERNRRLGKKFEYSLIKEFKSEKKEAKIVDWGESVTTLYFFPLTALCFFPSFSSHKWEEMKRGWFCKVKILAMPFCPSNKELNLFSFRPQNSQTQKRKLKQIPSFLFSPDVSTHVVVTMYSF